MPKYRFNPHRHVKIWLSRNPSVFLNPMNQLRLVRMRAINPYDEIHLVYDSRLLNEISVSELSQFCERHHIIPIDVFERVVPECKTDKEKMLLDAYEEEILHLQLGGNLASASDKLRLLSPVYRLGAYTDFDVDVDTRELPSHIEVNAPILIAMGSFFPYEKSKDERISVNNDFFAVIDERNAKPYVEAIQSIGLQLYGVQKGHGNNPYIDASEKISKLLIKLSAHQNARQIRRSIMRLSATNEIFYRMMLNMDNLIIDGERLVFQKGTPTLSPDNLQQIALNLELNFQMQLRTGSENHKKFLNESRDRLSTAHVLDFNREIFVRDALDCTVIETTGPTAFCYGLFGKNHFSSKEMDKLVNPFGLDTYHLSRHFKSSNGYPMHLLSADSKNEYLSRAHHDASWSLFGMKKIDAQESVMDDAAKIIQKAVMRRASFW